MRNVKLYYIYISKTFILRRKFFTNLTLLIFLNLLVKPFWIFGIDRVVQNSVGAEEYGLYFSLFNFSLLLNILLDLGITNYNNRNIAQHNHLLSKSLSNIVGLKFLLAFIYALLTLLIAVFIGYSSRQFYILLFLILNQFISSFILYLRANLSGLHLFKTDSFISVLDRTLMIILCGFLLWSKWIKTEFRIEWFVYAQTVSYSLTLFVTTIIVYGKTEFSKLNLERKYFIAILKKSYPFAVLALLMMFYYRIDSVMLERMLPNGKEQAGIYAQGYRILDALTMFAFLYAGLLLPMFSKMIKQKESINKLTLFSFLLLIVPTIGISLAAFFYKVEIMDVLYKHHVTSSSTILGILLLCFIGISVSYIFGTLLTANGNLKELNIIAASSVTLNIILNIILIPRYFAIGSAVASLITQSISAIAQFIVAKKVFNFRFKANILIKLILFVVGVYFVSSLSISLDYYWIFKLIGILLITLTLAFVLRLLHLKMIINLLFNGNE